MPWPELRIGALLEALDGVDLVIVGGVAAVAHGSALLTQDLDAVHAVNDANLERLSQALWKLHARVRGADELAFVPDPRELARAQILRLATDAGDLDLITAPKGARGYARLRENAIDATVGGVTVKVASLDDLIAMKRASGRLKDRLQLEELEAIRRDPRHGSERASPRPRRRPPG